MNRTIGVLALQGNFEKHQEMLGMCGVTSIQVKKPEHLEECDGLIIPGGESTTLTKLMRAYHLLDPIKQFAKKYPVMGTCAGVILLSSRVDDERVTPLCLLDAFVSRNAYGRQVDSFTSEIQADFLGEETYKTIFIRAPRILETGKSVKILMEYDGEAIMIQQNRILGLTFHPELTEDPRIHNYFLSI